MAEIDTTKLDSWFSDSEVGNEEWRAQVKDDINLYLLNHWDAATKQKLTEEGRPPLVIPKIYPVINFLDGYFRQNRLDLVFAPRKGSTSMEAELLTDIFKTLFDLSEGDYQVAEWFFYGLITGRSWITGEIDYDEDADGELAFEVPDPLSIFPDPNSIKYDYKDAQYLCKIKMVHYDDLIDAFPDKEEGILTNEGSALSLDDFDFDSTHTKNRVAYEFKDAKLGRVAQIKMSNIRIKEWYYIEKQKRINMESPSGRTIEVPDNPEFIKDLNSANTGATVIESSRKTKKVLHRLLQAGSVILEDYEKPLGEFNEIPFTQFIVKKVRKEILSVVTPLKDLQREVDKGRSQALAILNSATKDGWWVEKESTDIEILKKNGGKQNFIGEYKAGKQPPIAIQFTGGAAAQAALERSEIASADIDNTSGVIPQLKGQQQPGGKEAAASVRMRQQGGMIGLEPLLDNFELSHKIFGTKVAKMITRSGFYTPENIMPILDIPNPDSPENVQKIKNIVQGVGMLFSNPETKRYNTKCTTRPSSPTTRMADFATLMEISNHFPGLIDPDILLEASDISQKEEILQRIKAKQQQAQQAAANGQPPPQMGGHPGASHRPGKPPVTAPRVHHAETVGGMPIG